MKRATLFSLESATTEATESIGRRFGRHLRAGDRVALTGELGSGKTTLVRGVAHGMGIDPQEWVSSPTYALLHEYRGPLTLYHFDLYRIRHEAEVLDLGLPEYLRRQEDKTRDHVVVVEWADRMALKFPPGSFYVTIECMVGNDSSELQRRICFGHDEARGADFFDFMERQ